MILEKKIRSGKKKNYIAIFTHLARKRQICKFHLKIKNNLNLFKKYSILIKFEN